MFRFTLLSESFTQGDELNAKGVKLRHKISKKYAREIKDLFKASSKTV